MKIKIKCSLIASVLLALASVECRDISPKYDPTWDSIDSRPLPSWFDEGKVGIFVHWGVYSVPSYINEWFWWSWLGDHSEAHAEYVRKNFKPGFSYHEFAPMFTAEFYDPDYWAELFKQSGAKYVVLTSKHHEGYALWPSSYGFGWNAMEVGPKRDLLGDLAAAIRKQEDLRFGIYYSLLEWFHSYYEEDKASGWVTNQLPTLKSIPALKEVVETYRPDVIWSDGEWEAPDTYWGSVEFLAWLYNESPVKDTVVTNDRWGDDTRGVHGGYYNFGDRHNPGELIEHKWENAMTIDKAAWTYRREAKLSDFLTPEELISELIMTVSCNGNLLVNVGPTKEGTIPIIIQERLTQMGQWLGINGEAIYNTTPWTKQNDTLTPGVWYTAGKTTSTVYATMLSWPENSSVFLSDIPFTSVASVKLLGSTAGDLEWTAGVPNGIRITLPPIQSTPSKWAWTLAIAQV